MRAALGAALLALLVVAGCDLLSGPSSAESARPAAANPIPNFSTQPLSGTIITIYLPRLFSDGSLGLAAAQRGIPAQDDQLAASLQALIQGPSGDERADDYEVALDRRTQVVALQREGDAALMTFDENLARVRGRPYSELVYWAIVYTATEAPGVQRVGLLQQDRPLLQFGYPAVTIAARASRSDAPSWVYPR
ncbi:MAG TPA: GerMN domain-containing protein [Chloroflexota bacterium]|jgi:spore germination protein GerM